MRGTTAYVDKRYYRPPERYYRWGAGPGGYVGAGEVSPLPYPFAPPPRSSSSLQRRLAAGGLRRAAVSGPSLSIPFGGVDPHLVLFPWMPVLPSFLLSFCLVLRSSVFGAIVVASLDFWLNPGLSSLEKASRLCGLSFGRIIFEFGSPVVPNLTTAVGTAGSPSCAVLPLPLGRYYRLGGTAAYGQRYYRCLPDSIIPYLCLIHVVLFGGLRFFLSCWFSVRVFGSR